MVSVFLQPFENQRIGEVLSRELESNRWLSLRAAVAFVQRSGVRHIEAALSHFGTGGSVEFIVGIDFGGSSHEGLQLLRQAVAPDGAVWIVHNRSGSTFHPKLYLFENNEDALLIVGSGNLTEGGLYSNYEAVVVLPLNKANVTDAKTLDMIHSSVDAWIDPTFRTSQLLTVELLDELVAQGLAPSEHDAAGPVGGHPGQEEAYTSLFGNYPPPPAPSPTPVPFWLVPNGRIRFAMTLHQTDVGRGQVTPGTSARSPEFFVPLVARRSNEEFWGWPHEFLTDPLNPGKMDRRNIQVRFHSSVIEVTMMTWPEKRDFRIRSKDLRDFSEMGDILVLEQTGATLGISYIADIVGEGELMYERLTRYCNRTTPNSPRRWGYFSS